MTDALDADREYLKVNEAVYRSLKAQQQADGFAGERAKAFDEMADQIGIVGPNATPQFCAIQVGYCQRIAAEVKRKETLIFEYERRSRRVLSMAQAQNERPTEEFSTV